MQKIKKLLKILGPGLVYAGAAIGVSHLVQSTRAGAQFSFDLIVFILVANLLKLPFFEMSVRYPIKTGKSLLYGYNEHNPIYLWLFLVMSGTTMFIIMGAISIVTAGITLMVFPIGISAINMAFVLLGISTLILILGKYETLDAVVKYIVIILSIATIAAVILVTPKLDFKNASFAFHAFNFSDNAHMLFLVAMIGWMPAPLDTTVWYSLWSCEKFGWKKPSAEETKNSHLDFYIGYIGTAIMACFFLALGAIVMYNSGSDFSDSAVTFAGQLIALFSEGLGSWAKPIIAISCLGTMFSTTLTCLDAFPRSISKCIHLIKKNDEQRGGYYKRSLLVTTVGTCLFLFLFLKNMKEMVDLATTISFLMTPVIGWMNYKLFQKTSGVSVYDRRLRVLAQVGIVFFTAFSLYYLYIKFL